jgi:transcriptional regulator with XRE-family HTH domain
VTTDRAESEAVADSESGVREEWRRWIKVLGRHTRRVREFLGLSQDELARRAGVSQGSVSRLEAGRGLNTPFLVIVRINVALAAVLRTVDPESVAEDVRRFLVFMEYLSPPADLVPAVPAAPPWGGAAAIEQLRLTEDDGLERLIRLYRNLPDRQRAGFLSVTEAIVTALSG